VYYCLARFILCRFNTFTILHLTKFFERCRRYGISLNPPKNIFGVIKGKLLGHIISKEDITFDLERVRVISQLPSPHNKKSMQYLFGKINFVRKFIPHFAETIKPLQKMIHKDVILNGTGKRRKLLIKSRFLFVKHRSYTTLTLVRIYSYVLLTLTSL
jgi:hypothetical protein